MVALKQRIFVGHLERASPVSNKISAAVLGSLLAYLEFINPIFAALTGNIYYLPK